MQTIQSHQTTLIVNPKPFLLDLVGHPVKVKLKWGMAYVGILESSDAYMNVLLRDTEEYMDSNQSSSGGGGGGYLGSVLIRCNNVLYIQAAPTSNSTNNMDEDDNNNNNDNNNENKDHDDGDPVLMMKE